MRAWRKESRFHNPDRPVTQRRLTNHHTVTHLIDQLQSEEVIIRPRDSISPALTIWGGDSSWIPNSVQGYNSAGVLKWLVNQAQAWRFLTSTQWRNGSAVDASVQIVPATAALEFGDETNPPDWSMARTGADTVTIASGDTLVGTFSGPLVGTGALTLSGVISPAQLTANANDYAPTGLATASVLRLSSDASRDITGIAALTSRVLLLYNVGAQNIVLKDSSGSSAAANQFALTGDRTLAADDGVLIWYDPTSTKWRLIA